MKVTAQSFKFSKNPILWIGFFVILLQFINNVLQHRPWDSTLVSALIAAAGAVVSRSVVSPSKDLTRGKHAKSLDAAGEEV